MVYILLIFSLTINFGVLTFYYKKTQQFKTQALDFEQKPTRTVDYDEEGRIIRDFKTDGKQSIEILREYKESGFSILAMEQVRIDNGTVTHIITKNWKGTNTEKPKITQHIKNNYKKPQI